MAGSGSRPSSVVAGQGVISGKLLFLLNVMGRAPTEIFLLLFFFGSFFIYLFFF